MYKVLIVEDEALYRRALRKIIESMEGYEVIEEMEDGEAVLEFCEQNRPDFVCMDVLMPGIDGLTVGQRIKEKFPAVIVFILSGYHDFRLVQSAMKSGINAYMTKPYNAEEIKRTFMKHQEAFTKDNDKYRLITESVHQKQIVDTFRICNEIVDDIFKKMTEQKERRQEFQKIIQHCVNYIGTLSVGNGEYYVQKYEPAEGMEQYPVVAEAFLNLLIQDMYRFQMLSRYPQFHVILSYIHSNRDKEITLNEIADLCGMSQGYITRIFKRYYGIGVVDYAHLMKMVWAKLYLACTELSISDISYSLGYNDPGYFGKLFKKYEEVTPSVYKREHDSQGYNIAGGFGRLGK